MDYEWSDHYVCRCFVRDYGGCWCIWRKRDGMLIKQFPDLFQALRWLWVWGPMYMVQ